MVSGQLAARPLPASRVARPFMERSRGSSPQYLGIATRWEKPLVMFVGV